MRPKELVGDFDQLRVAVEPIEPARLAIVLRLVDHVEQVPTIIQADMLHGEVLPPKLPDQLGRYVRGVPVLVGLEFDRNLFDEPFFCSCSACFRGSLNRIVAHG